MDVDKEFGNYVLSKILFSATRFSAVALVYDRRRMVQFAGKIFSRENPQFMLIEQEIRIQQALSHPNIVPIIDVVYNKTQIMVVMPYYENGDLVEAVSRMHISMDKKYRIFRQVVRAIAYLHEKNIAHLDIKPENVFLDSNMNAALADFGCCETDLTKRMPFFSRGTVGYTAPEVFSNRTMDHRPSDIWSLGILLFALCTSRLPWLVGTDEEIADQIKNAQFHDVELMSIKTSKIFHVCCKINPKERINAEQLLSYLNIMLNINDEAKPELLPQTRSLRTMHQAQFIGIDTINMSLKKSVNVIKSQQSITRKYHLKRTFV